eukprot:8572650-Ditylum_brightwellii.AAC.1
MGPMIVMEQPVKNGFIFVRQRSITMPVHLGAPSFVNALQILEWTPLLPTMRSDVMALEAPVLQSFPQSMVLWPV